MTLHRENYSFYLEDYVIKCVSPRETTKKRIQVFLKDLCSFETKMKVTFVFSYEKEHNVEFRFSSKYRASPNETCSRIFTGRTIDESLQWE